MSSKISFLFSQDNLMISLIVAMAKNRVIGNKNQLPWHLPADLKHFKAISMGKPIIMGRKTFESIGKALPGRKNIVISRNLEFDAIDITTAHSLDEAIQFAQSSEEVLIIGGENIFLQALPRAQRIYLTLIETEIEGDTYFPNLNPKEWKEISRKSFSADEKNPFNYSFIVLEKMQDKN